MNTYVASWPEGVPARARPEAVVRLVQLTQLLRRHLWLIGLCAILAGAGAFIYAHTLPKTYTANSIMSVEGDRFVIPELQGALRGDDGPDPMPSVHTAVQALTSRALVSQLTSQLHLERDPEFNSDLRPPTLMQRVKGLVGNLTAPFLPKAPKGPAAAPPSNEAVVGAVSKALSIFQDNRSLVISVSFVSQDPQLAARAVNTLIDDYVASRAQYRASANEGANSIITRRVDQARVDLLAIEKQMQDLRNKGDVVGLRAGSIGQQQVEELTTALASATLQRSELEVNYERAVASARQGSSDALASVLNSPTVSRLRDEEAQASRALADLSTHYGPNHPSVRSTRAELSSAHRQLNDEIGRIVASLGAQLRVARAQEADVRQQLDQARLGAVKGENARARLDQLQQEAATRRNLYQTLLERSQQTMAQPAADATPDMRVLSPAVPPGFPSGPHMMLAGLMGGSGGALLGCLLALTRLHSVRGFETAEDVTVATGLVVLATLPRRLIRRDQGVLAMQASQVDVGGADIEAMRVLRHRLRFAGRTGVPRCTLFVPETAESDAPLAAPIAAAFARAAAADGERVLLIEGDLRAPRLRDQLGDIGPERRAFARPDTGEPDHGVLVGTAAMTGGVVASGPAASAPAAIGPTATGIVAALAGSDWREAVIADRQPGLDLLLAREPVANAHALLNGVPFQNLLVETRAEYDLVVLHAPPAATSDAASLVQRADAAVMVLDGRVNQAVAQEAVTRLGALGRTPLVAVLLKRI